MEKAKSITIAVGVFAVLLLAGYWFVTWSARSSLEKIDWQGLTDLIKAPLGESVTKDVVVEERPQTTPQPANTKAGWANPNPDEIKRTARLVDTYVAAVELGNAAHDLLKEGATIPSTSAELQRVSPRLRLDAWGRPFCLADVSGRVAVISFGAGVKSSPRCNEAGVSPRDLASLSADKLYRYPSGTLVFIAAARK